RVAGLWLADRLADRLAVQPELVDAVTEVVRGRATLPEAHAWRAERTARRLMTEIRVMWRGQATEGAQVAGVPALKGDAA
ncbi:MAG: hypothetical protein ACT4PL_05880, partial [Phycisphaerales bacterium]